MPISFMLDFKRHKGIPKANTKEKKICHSQNTYVYGFMLKKIIKK